LLHGQFRQHGTQAPLEIRLRAYHQRLPDDGTGTVGWQHDLSSLIGLFV